MPDTVYNEIEPYCVEWLRNLVAAGELPAGHVDERSIADLRASDVAGTSFHTFAGIGGWPLALRMAGWPDNLPVWTGSAPCQPWSPAGERRGVEDERHLWPEWFRLIRECRPPVVFGEQVARGDGLKWFDGVRTDLEGINYAVGMAVLPAASVSTPHARHRIYFVAYTRSADVPRPLQQRSSLRMVAEPTSAINGDCGLLARIQDASDVTTSELVDDVPASMGAVRARVRAYGNAIVPPLAAAFICAAAGAIGDAFGVRILAHGDVVPLTR